MSQIALALQDWEYIKKSALKGKFEDPFIMTSEKSHDLALLKDVVQEWRKRAAGRDYFGKKNRKYLISKLDEDIEMLGKLSEPRDKHNWPLFGGSRNVFNQKEATTQFLKRISMAAIGGAFLIGPMLVMVLHKSLLTTLLTSSVCVILFGFILAFALDDPFNVLSGTAAYAAVLVVFVGTSGH
jgi:hypothetical protein